MATALRAAVTLLVGVMIFVGAPLLAWGLGDLPGFLASPARLAYIALALLLQLVAVIRLPAVGREHGSGKKTVRRQRLSLLLLQVIPLAIVVAAPYGDRRSIAVLGEMPIIRYLGLAMFAGGFILMHWAEAALGKQFSVQVTIQEGHQLVTDGPYRRLRHPRYLGIILFTAGISLVYRSWLALILVAALALVLIWRIQDEEALLGQEFGADWQAYMQRSWRLIPFVY